MEVSIIPCDKWTFRVSLLSVGRIIRQEVRQPGKPTSIMPQLAPRDDGPGRSSVSWAQRLSGLNRVSGYPQPVASKDYGKLWKHITSTTDDGKAVRTLAEILADKEGRNFILRLGREDAEFCIEILDHVCRDLLLPSLSPSQMASQGIAVHGLNTDKKQAFFVTLRRLAEYYGRLPDSMIIPEKIEVEDGKLASGGFADTRIGRYTGHLVAVKALRVTERDDFLKIRKVRTNDVFSDT